MPSKKSSSNEGIVREHSVIRPDVKFHKTLFRKNLTRFWPLWALYAAIWIIVLPVMQSVSLLGSAAEHETLKTLASTAATGVWATVPGMCVWLNAVAGCLFAMALFSYLYSARAVGMMHSFPIYRETIFITNYLSGAAVFLTVDVAVTLLTAAVQGAAGVLVWKNLGIWFLCNAGIMFFFYSFAVFCAMFTGQILALPIFYAILNGLVAGLNLLIQSFFGLFLFGYNRSTPAWIIWMTPAWNLRNSMRSLMTWEEKGLDSQVINVWSGVRPVVIYMMVGLVLTVLAAMIYRTRRSETAGDVVAVRCMRPVFQWGVAFCCALGLGLMLYFLIYQQFTVQSMENPFPVVIAYVLFSGLIGYFAAQMFLKKSFHVFRGSWKGAAVLMALLLLFGACTAFDVFGMEKRTPEPEAVSSLNFRISGENECSGTVKSTEVIKEFCAAQKKLVAEKKMIFKREKVYNEADENGKGIYRYGRVSLIYNLKNGGKIKRIYNIYYANSDLIRSEDNVVSCLANLVRKPAIQKVSMLGGNALKDVTGGEMEYTKANGDWDSVSIDRNTAQALYIAINKDIAAGHFGVNQFNHAAWLRDTYVNTVSLYFKEDYAKRAGNFMLSSHCTAVIAVLKNADIIDADHPLVLQKSQQS